MSAVRRSSARVRPVAVIGAVLAAVVAGLPGTAYAEVPPPVRGETVVGEVVRAFSESHGTHDGEPAAAAEADLLTWIEPADGEAVRVPTEDLADVEVGATVEATLGGPVRDEPSVEDGLEPALAVLDSEVLAAAAPPAQATPSAVTNKVTVVMVRPGGFPQDATSRTTIINLVNGPVAKYWSQQTRGAVQLAVTASYNWIPTIADCTDPMDLWLETADRVNWAGDWGDHLVLYVPPNAPGCGDGLGTVGSSLIDGGLLYTRWADASILAHEFGHNFGLNHAGRIQCQGAQETGTCITDEYGDFYDVMGASWGPVGSLNPIEADLLGVLPANQVQTVTSAGNGATVTLAPVSGTTGVRTIRLDDSGGSGDTYYLEYRPAAGQDTYLSRPTTNSMGLQPGVLLRKDTFDSLDHGSLLIDATPGAGTEFDLDVESAFPVNAQIDVAGGAFTVQVTAAGATAATIRVYTASDPAPLTAIEAKYDAEGGSGGTLGAAQYPEICGLLNGGCMQGFAGGDILWSPTTGAHVVSGAIRSRYQLLSGQDGGLGYPTGDATCGLAGGGCSQSFVGGDVYSAPGVGTYFVSVSTRTRYLALGAQDSDLGYPESDTSCTLRGGGCVQAFENGSLFSATKAATPHVVSGDVLTRYLALGNANGGLGYPTADITCGLADSGCAQHFAGGSIYSSAGTGARFVSVSARTRYVALGGPASALGYPTMDTACGLRGGGCAQSFQNGNLYAASKTAPAFQVSADVRTRYVALGGQNSGLGYPTMDTACGLTAGGCAQNFQVGAVYWSSTTGARTSVFSVRSRYVAARGQNGGLGYPTSDTVCTLRGGGCVQHFQNASIFAGSRTAAGRVVAGPILTHYLAIRHVNSRYGYPISEQYAVPGGVAQRFQGGTLTYVGGRVR